MIRSRFEQLSAASFVLPGDWSARCASPALVVRLDHVRENLARMGRTLGGDLDRWRPHVKTAKIPAVLAEYARAGVRSFKAATPREARVLFETLRAEGVSRADLLLAYPLVGPSLERLAELAAEFDGCAVSVLCERVEDVDDIDERLGIFVDLNPGMNRTGLPREEWERARAIAARAGDRFRGLHYYDGHVNGRDAAARRRMAHDGYDDLLGWLAEQPEPRDFELVTSGTPAFRYALDYAPFAASGRFRHRVSPGTVVYHDLRSEQELEDLDLVPAAVVMARVVSRPAADRVTCDAGSKSIAAEAGDPCAFAIGRPALEALTPSEEHLPLRVHGGPVPERGEILMLVPRHVCPTVNLAEEALVVDGDNVAVHAVTARAHDLLD